ncbi:MAG TPA: DUF6265 family protein [Vicinamibacterales bacterium]|nr:DUF6265 family protein [Vicinamibacterales bacterium]
MRLNFAVCSTSVVCVLASLAAQERPDLSGIWIATTEAPQGVPAAPSPVFGTRFGIKQDAAEVTVTRVGRDGAFPLTLPLDGTELRWRVPGRLCQGDSERIEKIAVEGTGLAYTLVGMVPPGGGQSRVSNIKYLLRPDGPDRLVVHGQMVQQGQPRPVATVYKRSNEALPPGTPPVVLPSVKAAPATIAQAAWIAGTWIGSSGTATTVEERWTPPASGAMLAIGRTLSGQQMASFEFLCIVEREGTLAYTAMPNGRSPATYFMLTSITPDSATFENPSHDYPKLVRYSRLPDGSLQTTISAGGEVRARSVFLKRQ